MDNDRYFDLIKGSGKTKSANQHDGFGDLLGECRVSSKEKVKEQKVDEDKVWIVYYNDLSTDPPTEVEMKKRFEVETKQEALSQAEELLSREAPGGEWEVTRAREKSKTDESKVNEAVWEITWVDSGYTTRMTDAEARKEFGKDEWVEISHGYLPHIVAVKIEESKVNELDEPDLERPEKARRKKPKRRKPVVDEPATDEVPEDKPVKEDPDEVPEIGEEPDTDEVPPPPEEIIEPEAPIEMRKEYLGRSEEVHYYFITMEGAESIVADFVITDQEGVKKYSAKDNNIEVTEENIADFIIEAIRDLNIAQIERGIFMEYIYPKLIEKAPEEEVIEEPEGEEGEERLLTPEEEEERPRESKKITDSVKEDKVSKEDVSFTRDEQNIVHKIQRDTKGSGKRYDFVLVYDENTGKAISWEGGYELSKSGEMFRNEFSLFPDGKIVRNVFESKNLIEMKVTDGLGNEFDVNLTPDDTEDAVIDINGREFRFSQEFASMWRDETGAIPEEGLEELALDALAMMEEEEYQELVAKDQEGEGEEDIIDTTPKSVPGEEDWPLKDRPEPEEAEPVEKEPTDDVDMSKGDINRPLKYPPEKEEGEEEFSEKLEELSAELFNKRLAELTPEESAEVHQAYREWQEVGEGKDQPGVRDGTGPAKDSAQRKIKGDTGKRKEAGEKCPNENKENENNEGDNDMDEKKTPESLHQEATRLEAEAKKLHTEAEDLKLKKEKEDKVKKEGIDPKKEDSEEQKIKKLSEEDVDEDKIADFLSSSDIQTIKNASNEILQKAENISTFGNRYDVGTYLIYHTTKMIKNLLQKKDKSKTDEKKSESSKIKKLSETDVAKGAKALIQLAKDALKNGDYSKAAEYATKLAEIEAVVPAEAEAEAKKEDKPVKKDDKKDKKPDKKEDNKPEEKELNKDSTDEKKKPPVCSKCGKRHWPFEKCSGSEEVEEAKDKDKEAKAKKEKEDKKKKEDKAKKDKEAKAKKDKAKKENKIPVEDTMDISERKSITSLKNLLGMAD